jgi:hypothetical protein
VKSSRTSRFRKAFENLPEQVQEQAREAYRQFKRNPFHPSLHFKQVHPSKPIYSVRINVDYRAVGIRDGDEVVWFWIGGHEAYDKVVGQLLPASSVQPSDADTASGRHIAYIARARDAAVSSCRSQCSTRKHATSAHPPHPTFDARDQWQTA